MMNLREDDVGRRSLSLVCGCGCDRQESERLFACFFEEGKGGKAGVSCAMESKRYLLLENFPPNLFRGLLEEKIGHY